ncbi:glycosyltransferase family 2 protein [Lactococcus taiwanensis]|uniref:Glycosyltransferase family 2 protein n=1 Tax=Lactococcus taiwanensis TaxID=1151742 RepID=A0AA45KGX6_9LACT|nr:glycosyltransferase family 2 protein [Lactococcus taiwanensis]KZK38141.1 surface polysaccharide [Lactococcus cremoris]QRZ10569.1 glycosyltransferase family 2 protein [Lactococcus taiwanensis]QSE77059.1 glycosyltransferase family 2 protein [Lactococcus taiwanensis]
MKSEKKILLIIPAYNESEGIVDNINTIKKYIKNCPYNLEYVVINDGSTDNEEEILTDNNINHIELIQNLGIGGAVQTGYMFAKENGYDIAVQFDGDAQHDIHSLPNLIEPVLRDEVDFTVGSRFLDESNSEFKSSKLRQLGIKILSNLIYITSKIKIKDVTSGYRAGNKKVIEQFVKRYPRQYPEPESYMHLFAKNIRVKEVGARMFERTTGESSINMIKGINYMISVSLSIIASSLIGRETE